MSPITLGSDKGIIVGPIAVPGDYRVWTKVTASPEIPVTEAGTIRIT